MVSQRQDKNYMHWFRNEASHRMYTNWGKTVTVAVNASEVEKQDKFFTGLKPMISFKVLKVGLTGLEHAVKIR